MKIAIHNSPASFQLRWISYCKQKGIPFKIVDCFSNDFIEQLKGCDALMWHHSQNDPKAIIAAKPILFALEQAGIKVFPNFNTNWHFDDKLGQKYLLESLGIPLVPTYVFYDKKSALDWAAKTTFPKVFKLRGGAGSANVKLAKTQKQAIKLINKAFGSGFSRYDALGSLKERWRKWQLGKTSIADVIKGVARFIYPPAFARGMGREIGYVYFQDFIPNNDHDIRVIVIGDKAFAIKRMVRKNDFRASGSGHILYEKHHFREEDIHLAFQIHDKLKSQCTAMDFVYDHGKPKVVEISYGFSPEGYDPCPGYWDKNLNWHEGKFDPYGWMVEDVLKNEE
jgi:glutathione synthase/RimK-type ligase-like ATP-grasp enzyme